MSGPDTVRCPNCFEATNATPCSHCGWQVGQDNPPPALALGRVLDGRYRVGRVLGHGGFGITYLAWDDNLQLRLAIKEYLPRDCVSRGPDGVSLAVYSGQAGDQFAYGLDRFLEEARTLAHFDQHPGIVTVKNFFRAHGTGYCVMDYVAGITLRQYLDQQPGGRISVSDALKLLTPVMDALRAVHKEGLLHRDLAPDNIYLTQDGRIKLLDFGAARFAASEHSKSLSIILKPGYAPEEQYRTKGKQGPWTDVYGLAATFYRAITGQIPPESLDRLDHDDLVPPSRLDIPITPGQEATLLKALAVKAGQRWQDMAELQLAWHNGDVAAPQPAAEPSGPGQPQAGDAPTTQPQKRSITGLLLALGPVLLILAMIALPLFYRPENPPPPPALAERTSPPIKPPTPMASPVTTPPPTPAMALVPTGTPSTAVTTAPAAPSGSATLTVATSTVPTATPTPSSNADAQAGSATPAGATPTTATPPSLLDPTTTPAPPSAPPAPGEKAPLYYAAALAPTANIPPEAPLCYKFMVDGPEEQLRKLRTKYSGLYDEEILTNKDGSKTLLAKRHDEAGKVITYFYSTSSSACNTYQQNRLDTTKKPVKAGSPNSSPSLAETDLTNNRNHQNILSREKAWDNCRDQLIEELAEKGKREHNDSTAYIGGDGGGIDFIGACGYRPEPVSKFYCDGLYTNAYRTCGPPGVSNLSTVASSWISSYNKNSTLVKQFSKICAEPTMLTRGRFGKLVCGE